MGLLIVDDIRLAGIPCQVEIEIYPAERGAREGGLQLEPDYDAGWDLYRVLDRKGYEAPWLEKKLDDFKVNQKFNDSIDSWLADQSDQFAEPDDWRSPRYW